MEEVTKNIEAVAKEVKEFTNGNNSKMEALEKKNAELEQKNADFSKQIEELKKENVDIARKISEISIKSINPHDGSNEVEKKYFANLDQVLRNFAKGFPGIKSEYQENAKKYAIILAKKQNLGDEEREQKYVKDLMEDANDVAFPLLECKDSFNAQSTYVGTDGGVAIAPAKRLPLYKIESEKTGLYQLVNKVPTSSNMAERLVTRAVQEGFWDSEFGSDKTINFGFDKVSIGTSIVKGVVPLTRTFVEDYQGNLYSYLYPMLTESLNNAIEKALFIGDGVNGKPKGIAMYGELGDKEEYALNKFKTVSVNTESDLLDAIFEYSVLAKTTKKDLMMHSSTLAKLLSIKDSKGRPLVQPNVFMDGAKWKIAGMNVYTSDFCPDFSASGNKSVFLGDFSKAYDVVERTSKLVEFAPQANNNEIIKYMLRQRVGGGAKGFDSLVVFKKA